MLIKIRRGWEIPEPMATPESLFRDRRRLLKAVAAGPILLAAPSMLGACDGTSEEQGHAAGRAAQDSDPSAGRYPFRRNSRYTLERVLTPEELATGYNNYYEFGSSKQIVAAAQKLPVRPWVVTIAGMVEKPMEIDVDRLLSLMPLEERLYRHRCVEAWSMAVPWSGFPLKALIDLARPLSAAKYLRMESFHLPKIATGQKASWYPWPYVEGLTLAEASNELAFIATGIYGRPMPKQNGSPLRLAAPWKYGFKSAKGLVRFEFTDKRPKNFWQEVQGAEYGFWANVNPKVPHPRWSQATERRLGNPGRIATRLYNGYGEFVADLYKGMAGEALFM